MNCFEYKIIYADRKKTTSDLLGEIEVKSHL